jgi:PAS domain S-box-containing protein
MGEGGFEESWSGFIANASDMFCVAGLDGRFKRLNAAWTATLGWDLDELQGRPWLDFVHPDDQEATRDAGKRLGAGAKIFGFDNRYRHKEGRYVWLSWVSHPVADQGLIYAVARVEDWAPEAGWQFVPKPFAVGALARALRALIDRPAAR